MAGLVGSSIGGISDYDVDYILIKAEGLPTTTVAASAFGFAFGLDPPQFSVSVWSYERSLDSP